MDAVCVSFDKDTEELMAAKIKNQYGVYVYMYAAGVPSFEIGIAVVCWGRDDKEADYEEVLNQDRQIASRKIAIWPARVYDRDYSRFVMMGAPGNFIARKLHQVKLNEAKQPTLDKINGTPSLSHVDSSLIINMSNVLDSPYGLVDETCKYFSVELQHVFQQSVRSNTIDCDNTK
ncbi:hypothetical protein BDP27DRAFT_1397562 [Rhodocollybia butyracea]|uniref:Uncharacterized protein n=1 Tax=Rhodocollybia butyracea TaxID=206335 RepID=A0A9P5QC10_9AGAR|nr:hypothetical protein BDP27DRAFT_1397562 [Rhodocollybia butyracea]